MSGFPQDRHVLSILLEQGLYAGAIETLEHTGRDAQGDRAVLIGQKDFLFHQIDFELSFGPDMGMTQAIACGGAFSGNLTSTGHGATFWRDGWGQENSTCSPPGR